MRNKRNSVVDIGVSKSTPTFWNPITAWNVQKNEENSRSVTFNGFANAPFELESHSLCSRYKTAYDCWRGLVCKSHNILPCRTCHLETSTSARQGTEGFTGNSFWTVRYKQNESTSPRNSHPLLTIAAAPKSYCRSSKELIVRRRPQEISSGLPACVTSRIKLI